MAVQCFCWPITAQLKPAVGKCNGQACGLSGRHGSHSFVAYRPSTLGAMSARNKGPAGIPQGLCGMFSNKLQSIILHDNDRNPYMVDLHPNSVLLDKQVQVHCNHSILDGTFKHLNSPLMLIESIQGSLL